MSARGRVRGVAVIAAVVVASAVLAGCAGSVTPGDGMPVPPSSSGSASADPELARAAAEHVDTAAMHSEYTLEQATSSGLEPSVAADAGVSWPWALIGTTDTSLVVFYAVGCGQHLGAHVASSADRVVVTIVNGAEPTSGACDDMLLTRAGTITLDRPLGDRQLVHAAVDREAARYYDSVCGDCGF